MNRILITGAAGFIGTNFVYYCLENYPDRRIFALDSLTYAGNIKNLESAMQNENFSFIKADILDNRTIEELLTSEKIDCIVNFAAESHVDRSILGPETFLQTNIMGTHSLLKAARKVWLQNEDTKMENHRFHQVSTDEVFGSLGETDPAFREDTPYAPNSPYAASKAAADHLVRSYHHTYGLKTTISNCSNNYGPFQFPEKLIPLMIINALRGKPLPIYGDGKNVRDWLHVHDHCRAIDLILSRGRVGQTYNIGGKCEKQNIEIVDAICSILDEICPESRFRPHSSLKTYVADRPGHDRRYAVNIEKIETELGFSPQENFSSGLKKTVDWYLANTEWWEGILDGSYLDWVARNYGNR